MSDTPLKSLTVAQMREADRRAIHDLGIPSAVLMDRAGFEVYQHLHTTCVHIVCGKGNNGGDGFVAARYCLMAGYDTHVWVLAQDDELSEDARLFKKVYTQLGGSCGSLRSVDDWLLACNTIPEQATLVDAILGTGTRGDLTGIVRDVIEHWPERPTLSVDIPSGMNADTGHVCGRAIQADETVTFQWSKVGFDFPNAQSYVGNVQVVDIGIPSICADDVAWKQLIKEV